MKKIFLIITIIAAFFSIACKTTDENETIQNVSEKNPIIVNEENKTITIFARVNKKYTEESTRHAIIFKDGKFGDKSLYKSYANHMDVLNALKKLGAKAGNNMTLENASETHVEGDIINFTVTLKDKEPMDMSDTIIDSNGNEIEFHFGGNEQNAEEKNTGCIACLDSCPVGLISNTTYTYGAVENTKDVEFRGDKEILTKDNEAVAITIYVP